MIQQTSILAYKDHVLPTIGTRQAFVYAVIKRIQPCSDQDISRDTGLFINQVTPRRGELVKMGLIEYAYTDKQKGTGISVKYWRVRR